MILFSLFVIGCAQDKEVRIDEGGPLPEYLVGEWAQVGSKFRDEKLTSGLVYFLRSDRVTAAVRTPRQSPITADGAGSFKDSPPYKLFGWATFEPASQRLRVEYKGRPSNPDRQLVWSVGFRYDAATRRLYPVDLNDDPRKRQLGFHPTHELERRSPQVPEAVFYANAPD
jgi:hypothetical protein